MDKSKLMQRAIDLAVENVQNGGGGPFAALVVKDDRIIATGANVVTSVNDPTAHAEIVAIRRACSILHRFELSGCEIYTTCEPCPMCVAAIHWARPEHVYYAALSEDAAQAGFADKAISEQMSLPYDQRKIPVEHLSHADALRPFRAWQLQPGKISY